MNPKVLLKFHHLHYGTEHIQYNPICMAFASAFGIGYRFFRYKGFLLAETGLDLYKVILTNEDSLSLDKTDWMFGGSQEIEYTIEPMGKKEYKPYPMRK